MASLQSGLSKMQTFDLADLASDRRRSSIVLPPIFDSQGAQADYLRALRAMLRGISAEVRQNVLPAAEAELATARDRLQRDMNSRAFDLLGSVARALVEIAERLVERILQTERRRHTRRWLGTVRSALGIDMAAVVRDEDLDGYLETAVTRNVGLIQSLADETVSGVRVAITNAILLGRTVSQLRKDLTARFAISDRRAKMIARDQIAKTNSDLNRIRHSQAGLNEYEWQDADDERVRKTHHAMNGRICRYDDPTVYFDGKDWVSRSGIGGVAKQAGEDFVCRCVGKAIVRFNGVRV